MRHLQEEGAGGGGSLQRHQLAAATPPNQDGSDRATLLLGGAVQLVVDAGRGAVLGPSPDPCSVLSLPHRLLLGSRGRGTHHLWVIGVVTGRLPWGRVTTTPAPCAGNYNLSSVLPTAPDMAQLKEGVRSVAGKLSVFANGVMTSIQVRGAAKTGSEEEGGLVVVKMRLGPLFSRQEIRFYITDLDVCYG